MAETTVTPTANQESTAATIEKPTSTNVPETVKAPATTPAEKPATPPAKTEKAVAIPPVSPAPVATPTTTPDTAPQAPLAPATTPAPVAPPAPTTPKKAPEQTTSPNNSDKPAGVTPPKAEEKKPEEEFKPVKTRKVLVIDSDKAVMHEIEEFTKRKAVKELKFFFAEDAKVCLDKMKSEEIDIAIIEILLPIINGRYILKIFEQKNIPAIIYTKLNNVEDLKKMSEWSAANIFLKKLTKPEDLVQFLKSKTEYKEDLKLVVEKLLNEMKNQEGKESQSSVKIVQCPKCNMILPPQSHFCNNCGQKIIKENKAEPINAKPAPKKEEKK